MSQTESTLQQISASLSNEQFKASDLDFYSLLRRQGKEGRLFFNQRRAIIFDVEAMGTLRQQLIETLGSELARNVLIRFGYTQGHQDAETLGEAFVWETEDDWLLAGSLLHILEGVAYVETEKVEFNRESGHFYMRGIWRNSYEAEEHLARYGSGDYPVCWMLTGYASGYATRFFDQEVLAVETKCVGQGDEHCCFEIRPVAEWGAKAKSYQKALEPVNIVDHKQAEQWLQESRERYRTLYAKTPAMLHSIDTQGRIVDVSNYWLEVLGYKRDAVIGQPLLEFLTEESKQYAQTVVVPDLIKTGHTRNASHQFVKKNGEIIDVLLSAVAEYDENGEFTRSLAVLTDVTERKRAEEALQESQTLYQSSIDGLPQNVYRIDREGKVIFGNKTYLDTIGMTLEECLGKTAYDFFPKELADKYTADDKRVMETGETLEMVEEHKVPSTGEMRYVQTVKVPIRDSKGKVVGLQGVFWDVTERELTEQKLAKRANELETVAQVGTIATAVLETNELLQTVADLTKERFGLYHAHIYLLNPAGNILNLAAGAGQIGRQMVAEKWSIPLAQKQSLVARAARTQKGVIVNDVHQDSGFFQNPRLPDTRSELAVPIVVGNKVLGVLDVQSEVVNYFTDEDVHIQSTLASQIGSAIHNARLFEQVQARAHREQNLREVTAQVRRSVDVDTIMRTAAKEVGQALGRSAFVYLDNKNSHENSQTGTEEQGA